MIAHQFLSIIGNPRKSIKNDEGDVTEINNSN